MCLKRWLQSCCIVCNGKKTPPKPCIYEKFILIYPLRCLYLLYKKKSCCKNNILLFLGLVAASGTVVGSFLKYFHLASLNSFLGFSPLSLASPFSPHHPVSECWRAQGSALSFLHIFSSISTPIL